MNSKIWNYVWILSITFVVYILFYSKWIYLWGDYSGYFSIQDYLSNLFVWQNDSFVFNHTSLLIKQFPIFFWNGIIGLPLQWSYFLWFLSIYLFAYIILTSFFSLFSISNLYKNVLIMCFLFSLFTYIKFIDGHFDFIQFYIFLPGALAIFEYEKDKIFDLYNFSYYLMSEYFYFCLSGVYRVYYFCVLFFIFTILWATKNIPIFAFYSNYFVCFTTISLWVFCVFYYGNANCIGWNWNKPPLDDSLTHRTLHYTLEKSDRTLILVNLGRILARMITMRILYALTSFFGH